MKFWCASDCGCDSLFQNIKKRWKGDLCCPETFDSTWFCLTCEFRYEEDLKQYEDAIKRMHFKKEAKNLFSSPQSKQEIGLELTANDLLSPPVRPALKLIPSWESVLCTLEGRLLTEFMKLEKWWNITCQLESILAATAAVTYYGVNSPLSDKDMTLLYFYEDHRTNVYC